MATRAVTGLIYGQMLPRFFCRLTKPGSYTQNPKKGGLKSRFNEN